MPRLPGERGRTSGRGLPLVWARPELVCAPDQLPLAGWPWPVPRPLCVRLSLLSGCRGLFLGGRLGDAQGPHHVLVSRSLLLAGLALGTGSCVDLGLRWWRPGSG